MYTLEEWLGEYCGFPDSNYDVYVDDDSNEVNRLYTGPQDEIPEEILQRTFMSFEFDVMTNMIGYIVEEETEE